MDLIRQLEEFIIDLPELVTGLIVGSLFTTIILINLICLYDGIKLYRHCKRKGEPYGLRTCVIESYKVNLRALVSFRLRGET